MANPFSQRVNRQLVLAGQHLQIPPEGTSASARLRHTGLLESALFHLYRAYLEMLRELAANYQVPQPGQISELSQLQSALAAAGKTPGEVAELVELRRNGFLAELIDCWQHFFAAPPEPGKEQPQSRPEGMISLRSLSNRDLDQARLEDWLRRLEEISDRHRNVMVEY